MWSNNAASQAVLTYQQRRHGLDASLHAASQQGYTSQDLSPITTQLRALDHGQEPWWLPGRPLYYGQLSAQTSALQGRLDVLERQLFDQARTDSGKQMDAAKVQIGQAQQNSAADSDVKAL